MQINKVTLHKSKFDGATKAFGSVEFNGGLVVNIKVNDAGSGAFVGWPGRKTADGKWAYEVAFKANEVKETVNKQILAEYAKMGSTPTAETPAPQQKPKDEIPF